MRTDNQLLRVLRCCAACVIALLLIVIVFLIHESWPVLREVGMTRFVMDREWHPTEGSFGMLPMLSASLAASVGALLLAGPLGIGGAVFCSLYAPQSLARSYKRILAVLAGIPSVVFGFWGLTVLVPLIARWEVVVVNERFGLRINEICRPDEKPGVPVR